MKGHVVKINGYPIGIAQETKHTKVDEDVEFTLCSFNGDDFSMWIPSIALGKGKYGGC